MSLFDKMKKKKVEPVIAYSPVEQGVPEPPVVSPEDKLEKVLANQAVIVQNQQVILDAITQLPEVIMRLAEVPTEQVEPKKKKVTK